MKTGATIHTMNGLKMYARKLDKEAAPPTTNGWWELQHLKRGLNANGRPFGSATDAPAKAAARSATAVEPDEKGRSGDCPV
jgi:hypothetical protein